MLAVSARNNSICTAHKHQGCAPLAAFVWKYIYQRGFSNTAAADLARSLWCNYTTTIASGAAHLPAASLFISPLHHQRTAPRGAAVEHKTRAPLLLFRTISLSFLQHSAKIDRERAVSYIYLSSFLYNTCAQLSLSVRERYYVPGVRAPHFSIERVRERRGSSD